EPAISATDTKHGHVHLGRAGVKNAKRRAEKSLADEVRRAATSRQRRGLTGGFVPQQQRLQAMIMAPQIPVGFEARRFWKRPEVTVLSLRANQLANHARDGGWQRLVVAHAQRLNARDKIFARKFARPWHQLGRRLAVA